MNKLEKLVADLIANMGHPVDCQCRQAVRARAIAAQIFQRGRAIGHEEADQERKADRLEAGQ
jgi:hypothetical protein